ncbi:hypothetical protein [Edaphobacter modestus]|uniref:Uncharacterized protein n=1 Tax=Edaphobacter modestus TaxID=388466 RepID=A0A4Q7YH00_9BACT|nr:hypothetical protein [Edaphobacter modestus]RZU35619.1 hypothetical protein BDD14_5702 [Edaphobacter modestus]
MAIVNETLSRDPEVTKRMIAAGNDAMDRIYRENVFQQAEQRHRRIEESSKAADVLFRAVSPDGLKEDIPLQATLLDRYKSRDQTGFSPRDSEVAKALTIRPFPSIQEVRDAIIIGFVPFHDDTTLTLLGPPYMDKWTSVRADAATSNAFANHQDGSFGFVQGTSGGWVTSAAGIWVQFAPKPPLPRLIQLRAYCPYQYQWNNASSQGYTAHTKGGFGLNVFSFDSQGHNPTEVQKPKYPIWNDGTGWFEDHSNPNFDDFDEDCAFQFSNMAPYFQAFPNRLYTACFWCFGSNDAGSGLFGNAISASDIFAKLGFVVVGQQ